MKAVIVNCFDTYEDRVDLLHDFFKLQGYDVKIIQSDFRHFKKVHRKEEKVDFIFVRSKPYYKNLSLTRLFSHYKYANDAFKIVENIKPDLLYTFIPPNSLAKFASSYKKRNKETKLIFDIIDLWPETIPIGKMKKYPPFIFWSKMRNMGLKYADSIITECDLFQSVLSDHLTGINTSTVYLAKKEINVVSISKINNHEIHLAYLGSINNIIDILLIKKIIETIKIVKPVYLHIIGDGEKKQELIDKANEGGAKVIYYGQIFDPQEKQEIFDKCHFGLNIFKNSVCVGLTMKSIDYFQHGLPVINNIQGDTTEIIRTYGIGINITEGLYGLLQKIIEFSQDRKMIEIRFKTKEVFVEKFSVDSFNKMMENHLGR
jgi:glycosyltransferase involved in cell wall biosynthesis